MYLQPTPGSIAADAVSSRACAYLIFFSWLCSGAQESQPTPAAAVPEALLPASQEEAQPGAQDARPAQPAQQDAPQLPAAPAPLNRAPSEDAVDMAAAAQRRLVAQSPPAQRPTAQPAPEPVAKPAADRLMSANSGVDAAVAKQSDISAKLAGASAHAPTPEVGAVAAAEAVCGPVEASTAHTTAADAASGPANAAAPAAETAGSTGDASTAEISTPRSTGACLPLFL